MLLMSPHLSIIINLKFPISMLYSRVQMDIVLFSLFIYYLKAILIWCQIGNKFCHLGTN